MSPPATPVLVDDEALPGWVRLRSWLGVFPLGVFVVVHFAVQSSAMGGFWSYEATVGWSRSLPGLWLAELLLLYLPLGFHVASGLYLASRRLRRGPGLRVLGPVHLQALTGIILLGFLAVHLWQFRVGWWQGTLDPVDFYDELCAGLSSTVAGGVPLLAVLYLAGVSAAAFHLAQGLYGLAGRRLAERRRPSLARGCVLLGIVLFCLGSAIVIDLATGSLVMVAG